MTDSSPETMTQVDRSGAFRRIAEVVGIRLRLILGVLIGNIRLTHALRGDWRNRYERAKLDLAAADPVFQPSRQWTIISMFYRLTLRARGLEGFKSTFGRFLSSYEPGNRRLFEAVHHLYFGELSRRDEWGLLDKLEEPALGNGSWVLYRGKRLSLDLLQSIDELYRMKDALGFERNDRVTFCELGAGYGRLADVVLSAMPNASFFIFDLPESLLLSQHYLTTLHPGAKAALYPESVDVIGSPDALPSYRLLFALPQHMSRLPPGTVDAFVNIYSFMEMGRKQIEEYFRNIDKLAPKIVYLKQHKREVNIYDRALNTSANYPVRADWKQVYDGTSALFEHVFETIYRLPN
jgi:putative sugar O-methyltransferase